MVVYNRRLAFAGIGGGTLSNYQMPWDKTGLIASFKYAFAAGLAGMLIIQIGWGVITSLDVAELLLTTFILTYLIHLVRQFKS